MLYSYIRMVSVGVKRLKFFIILDTGAEINKVNNFRRRNEKLKERFTEKIPEDI